MPAMYRRRAACSASPGRPLFGSFCPDEGDVEARCMLAFSLRIGNHFIAADHGGHSRAEVLELTRKWLLR
ncbi:hypothetical protein HRW23_29150 [Streptomyces lunaelactis]|uniref:hypothetical protein n=1 Tax=Streptomyces lunaelactis TaxID=1535768 RepID=UPI00158574C3|nr:hypothetical protein [Streptomyces lunaelactis]NUK04158.1 hypothetical protein [Streptomyces lunaelactis]NUK20423.1 hypothetical protein [Streptomyces lunaelactis]NUK38890.1 hypothetical protein [Streptomyces lunaelactis]NUK40642.1 hypothetical protein [Streptomyces lunaelactis]NUK52836.1 hypothetical protein [Streptomyces lunaelactis]